MKIAATLALVTVLGICGPGAAVGAGETGREIPVSWDFGYSPSRNSDVFGGERQVPVTYETSDCLTRFSLEQARYEFPEVDKDGKVVREGMPLLTLTFVKHFVGDFEQLPKVTVAQKSSSRTARGGTGSREEVGFPYREKSKAETVDDWKAAGVEFTAVAPGVPMGLNNPKDWLEILVSCE